MSATSTSGPLPPDVNRGFDLVIVSWVTVLFALLLVSLRFYVRGVLRKSLGWDDYLILLSIIFAVAQCVFAQLQVHNGFGRNIQYLTPFQLERFGLYTTVVILLQNVGTALVRISVCLFVLRLVPTIQKSYRIWIWAILVFNAVLSVAVFLAFCFQCIPLSALWNRNVKARCFQRAEMTKIAQVQGSAAAITDLLCVLLPMLLYRTLQASLRDKMAIFLMIGFGLFTTATAIARTTLLDLQSENITWDNLPVGIWACLEQNIGIAVASMPALRQLITIRKKKHPSYSSEPFGNHNSNARAHLNSFPRLPYTGCVRLPDNDASPQDSSDQFSKPTPAMSDIESYDIKRGSLIKSNMASQPFWTDRKISLAETVEMSRVSPTPTFVERKPSSAETLRLSMVTPSWGGHSKSSSIDKISDNVRRLSELVSPLSVDKPPPLFSVRKMQQLGRFEETGLRNSRVATPEEMVTLGNPAATGYLCKIEAGTPKTSPKTPRFPKS